MDRCIMANTTPAVTFAFNSEMVADGFSKVDVAAALHPPPSLPPSQLVL